MAGEWIAVDLALDQKPEVQELIDTTGQPVEVMDEASDGKTQG